jgi:hypothetical protein
VCLSADTGPHSPGKEWLLCQKTVLKMIKHWKEELLSMDLPFFFLFLKIDTISTRGQRSILTKNVLSMAQNTEKEK